VDEYADFCARYLGDLDEIVREFVATPAFDLILVNAVTEAFPAEEREERIARYRGILGDWAGEQQPAR
jgi:hypothetical protein